MYVRVGDGLVEEVRLDIFTSHPGFSRHSWRAGPAPSYPASPPEYAGYARSLTRPAHARPLRTPAESVSTGRWPTCAGCRTAGNGSAATRRTATCRTRPTSWVIREWSRWLPTGKSWHADWPCGGPEARSWSSRAARPSIRVNVRAGHRAVGCRTSTSPTSTVIISCSRRGSPAAIRSSRARWSAPAGWPSPRPSSSST